MPSPKKISERSACTAPQPSDKLILSGNSDSKTFYLPLESISELVLKPVSNAYPAPANSTANGTPGIDPPRYDSNYLYICVALNTWRRFGGSTF